MSDGSGRPPRRTGRAGGALLTAALWTAATAATSLTAQEAVHVGPTVQVSAGHPDATHYEVLAAVDPNDPMKMIVGSFIYPPDGSTSSTVVYASRDGGRHWQPTLEGEALWHTSDPAPAYGPDGTAYYTASSLGPSGTPREDRRMLLYRSPDGGERWEGPFPFTYSDRQYITVDATGGEHHGRIYVNGNNRVPYGVSDFVVFTSGDRGRTFDGPGKREGFGSFGASLMGNAVVTSSGTLIGVFIDGELVQAIASTDGGASLEPAVAIADGFVRPGNRKSARNNVMAMPYLAIDPGSARFSDRLYAVWGDRRSGRSRILLSASADRGATWTPPLAVDDGPATDSSDSFMPTVAVNRDGVVGVAWYDRRNHADNLGWDMRFAASVDGGASFLPSVEVSERGTTFREDTPWTGLTASVSGSGDEEPAGLELQVSLNTFVFLGGDTAGLVADAAGTFHPVWVDNRTGVPQVWTAPIRVGGAGPAGVELAGRDVTDRVSLEVEEKFYDRSSGTLTAVVRLENRSSEELRGPFGVHVESLASDLGEIVIAGARNGAAGPAWSFPEEALPAGASSDPQTWRFTISSVRPYRDGDRYTRGLLRLKVRITERGY